MQNVLDGAPLAQSRELEELRNLALVVPENRSPFAFNLVSAMPTAGTVLEAADNMCVVESWWIDIGPKKTFNGSIRKRLRVVSVVGLDIELGDELGSTLFSFVGATDIFRLEIRARKISVTGRFHIPGADIVLRAHTIAFLGNGRIETSPKPERASVESGNFGEAGQSAGDIQLFAKVLKEDSADQVRFVANGAPGIDGKPGTQPPPRDRIACVDMSNVAAVARQLLTIVSESEVNMNDITDLERAVKASAETVGVVGVLLIVTGTGREEARAFINDHAAEIHRRPVTQAATNDLFSTIRNRVVLGKDGEDASSGMPGSGGDGGNVRLSRADGHRFNSYQARLEPGTGGRTGAVPGGLPSVPTSPIAVQITLRPKAHRTPTIVIDMGPDKEGGPVQRDKDARPTRPYRPGKLQPAREGKYGKWGTLETIQDADCEWLDAAVLQKLLRYCRSGLDHAFTANSPGSAMRRAVDMKSKIREAIAPYSFLLDPAQREAMLAATPMQSRPRLMQIALCASDLQNLVNVLDAECDSFGNPLGWLPRLEVAESLSSWRRLFATEVRLLTHAAIGAGLARVERMDAASIQASQGIVEEELRASVEMVSLSQRKIAELSDEAATVDREIAGIETQLNSLHNAAANETTEQEQIQLIFSAAFSLLSALTKVIPVGQPLLGTVGGILFDEIAAVDLRAGFSLQRFGALIEKAATATKDDSVLDQIATFSTRPLQKNLDAIRSDLERVSSERAASDRQTEVDERTRFFESSPTRAQWQAFVRERALVRTESEQSAKLDSARKSTKEALSKTSDLSVAAGTFIKGLSGFFATVDTESEEYKSRVQMLLTSKYGGELRELLNAVSRTNERKRAIAIALQGEMVRLSDGLARIESAGAAATELTDRSLSSAITGSAAMEPLYNGLFDRSRRRLQDLCYFFQKAYQYHQLADVDQDFYELHRLAEHALSASSNTSNTADPVESLQKSLEAATSNLQNAMEGSLSIIAQSLYKQSQHKAAPKTTRTLLYLPQRAIERLRDGQLATISVVEDLLKQPYRNLVDARLEEVGAIRFNGELPAADNGGRATLRLVIRAEREQIIQDTNNRVFRFVQAPTDDPIEWSFYTTRSEGDSVIFEAEEVSARMMRLREKLEFGSDNLTLRPFAPSLFSRLSIWFEVIGANRQAIPELHSLALDLTISRAQNKG